MAGRWLAKNVAGQTYATAEDVIRAIYAGTFRSNCLIPVKPGPYMPVLGSSIWVCSDEAKARAKQKAGELAFTVAEFRALVDTARQGPDALRGVIEAKRCFGGVVEEGG